MARDAAWLSVEADGVDDALRQARRRLENAQNELVLDFASVRRIDSSALRALDELTDAASGKGIQLVLNKVSVDIYKVLKLMGLTSRLSFRG